MKLESFSRRHLGVSQKESKEMLKKIGFNSMNDFIQAIVPANIYDNAELDIGDETSEDEALKYLNSISKKK